MLPGSIHVAANGFQAQPVLRNLTASLSGELSVTVDAQIGDTESSKKKG